MQSIEWNSGRGDTLGFAFAPSQANEVLTTCVLFAFAHTALIYTQGIVTWDRKRVVSHIWDV